MFDFEALSHRLAALDLAHWNEQLLPLLRRSPLSARLCEVRCCLAFETRERLAMPVLAVGAAFEFHAGCRPQAPDWMQRRGLEWLYRLAEEPSRLWRRYLVHNAIFVVHTLAYVAGLGRHASRRALDRG